VARVETMPVGDDVLLLMTALVSHLRQRVRQRLSDAGFPELRDSHGYLFQHLMLGPMTIGALADAVGVTQQAVSKTVIELERSGYVRRRGDSADRRVRTVELTDRGEAAIEAARKARAEIDADVRRSLGRTGDELVRSLRRLAEQTGAYAEMNDRRLRLPS
jgi:DNA-binding MarR family transcriptional regulator